MIYTTCGVLERSNTPSTLLLKVKEITNCHNMLGIDLYKSSYILPQS